MANKNRRSASELIPHDPSFTTLRAAAATCQACGLWKDATQTVFGDGSPGAKLMFVGEQPGNEEDLRGKPFVGPAGKLLDTVLDELGINRRDVYITNAVKHFKWIRQGKRRIHEKPRLSEIAACRPWLEAEIAVVKPKIIVCLGATAAQTLLGQEFRVTQKRGQFVESSLAPYVMATVHPSSILRALDRETRRTERARFVADLRRLLEVL